MSEADDLDKLFEQIADGGSVAAMAISRVPNQLMVPMSPKHWLM